MKPLYSRRDDCAVVTLNRPDALNALSFGVISELDQLFDEVENSDARALIITGSGERSFCAGADIKELRDRTLRQQRDDARRGQLCFHRLTQLPMPSIAAINGFAFGGGLELAMACTFRVASHGATMGQPEIKLGLVPGYGGTQRLPRLVGEGRAMELILSGRTIDANEALDIGLIHRIVDGNPVDAAVEYAKSFSIFSQPVVQLARDAVARSLDMSIDEGLQAEADLSTLAFQTEDAAEGMAAFEEKRKPDFKDR